MGSRKPGRLPPSRSRVLPFRAVNRRGSADHDAGLQRHHLLPRQLLRLDVFDRMIRSLGRKSIGFEDFRRNGLLLPSRERAAVRMQLPLHRGPHPEYNEMVIDRVAEIERGWQQRQVADVEAAGEEALRLLGRLQQTLRARMLNPRQNYLRLHANDPLAQDYDFSELDEMAERLWRSTQFLQDR